MLMNAGTIFKCTQLLNLLKLVPQLIVAISYLSLIFIICKMEIEKLQVDS